MQAAFHGMTALGLLGFYWPPPSDYPRLSWRQLVWACDPIGSLLMTAGTTLLLLGFDWAGGTFPWRDAHVLGPLVSGAVLLILFGLYEWKGRTDGIIAHVFFSRGPNFGLSVFAFAVEGFIFYSAVNSVVPQIVLNLGFETNAWRISVRQLAYNLVIIVSSVPVTCVFARFISKWSLILNGLPYQVVCDEVQGSQESASGHVLLLPRRVNIPFLFCAVRTANPLKGRYATQRSPPS
jgi:hypothetical protein